MIVHLTMHTTLARAAYISVARCAAEGEPHSPLAPGCVCAFHAHVIAMSAHQLHSSALSRQSRNSLGCSDERVVNAEDVEAADASESAEAAEEDEPGVGCSKPVEAGVGGSVEAAGAAESAGATETSEQGVGGSDEAAIDGVGCIESAVYGLPLMGSHSGVEPAEADAAGVVAGAAAAGAMTGAAAAEWAAVAGVGAWTTRTAGVVSSTEDSRRATCNAS